MTVGDGDDKDRAFTPSKERAGVGATAADDVVCGNSVSRFILSATTAASAVLVGEPPRSWPTVSSCTAGGDCFRGSQSSWDWRDVGAGVDADGADGGALAFCYNTAADATERGREGEGKIHRDLVE